MLILLHSSKTMRQPEFGQVAECTIPVLHERASELAAVLKKLSVTEIQSMMKVSSKLAGETKDLIDEWTDQPSQQRAAVDSFLGDIYSGLQVSTWDDDTRQYAQQHLRILSGLYGILRPLDGIYPYRHEMGYKIPEQAFSTMYDYWGSKIADELPAGDTLLNLTAVEYAKTVTKYVDKQRVITPKFLTISPKTGEPNFVTVHTKIARGAFARWTLTNKVESSDQLMSFDELGYLYDESLSSSHEPVFVCQQFLGFGLSVRLN